MGRFVSNSHVRSDDAEKVVRGVLGVLTDAGYASSPPGSAGERRGTTDSERRVYVSNAIGGWVSVFDSDAGEALALAGELSQRLSTWSLSVTVDEGESRGYVLHDCGAAVDGFSFERPCEVYEIGELSPELAALFDEGTPEEIRREVERRSAEFQDRLADFIPAHVRELHRRVNSGIASPEEIQAYDEWTRDEMPRLTEEILTLSGEAFDALEVAAIPREDAAAQEAFDATGHVECLRPLFVSGASAEMAGRILESCWESANEALTELLPLIGISPDYASLELRDLTEPPEDGSDGPEVRIRAELIFDKFE